MLKTRKRAESNTPQPLPFIWDDKPEEGRKKTFTLETTFSQKQEPHSEHDETAEDAVNALLGGNEEETIQQPQANFSRTTSPTAAGQSAKPVAEKPEEPPAEEPSADGVSG